MIRRKDQKLRKSYRDRQLVCVFYDKSGNQPVKPEQRIPGSSLCQSIDMMRRQSLHNGDSLHR